MQSLSNQSQLFTRSACTFADEPEHIKAARKAKATSSYDDRKHRLSEQERKVKLNSSL